MQSRLLMHVNPINYAILVFQNQINIFDIPCLVLLKIFETYPKAKSRVHMHQHFRRLQVLSSSHWWWLLSWNGGLQGWRLWGSSPPNYIQGKAPALFVPTPNSPFSPSKLTWNGSMLPLAWYCAQKIRRNLTQSKILSSLSISSAYGWFLTRAFLGKLTHFCWSE